MLIQFERKSLASHIDFSGQGIHSGEESRVHISPGDRGIWFHFGGDEISATPENVSRTPRSTWLGPIRTIEHLMSAFAGLEITDAEVAVEKSPELPILGGGSKEYVDGLITAGIRPTGVVSSFSFFGRAHAQNGHARIAVSVGEGKWKYEYDTGQRWPGKQVFEYKFEPSTYQSEIAPARTFALAEELESLMESGLGKGGNEQNTLILGSDGYLTPCLFPDEPPRHKILDCIGDLALTGIPARFLNVSATGSGHEMNVIVAKRIVELSRWEIK